VASRTVGAALLVLGLALSSCSDERSNEATRPSSTGGASMPSPRSTTNPTSGWHLDVSFPTDESQVSQPFTVCYAVTGPSRSADVVLFVSLEDPPAEGPDAQPKRYPAKVGRGTIRVPVDKLSTGRHDVRVTFRVDGEKQGDVVLDNLRIAGDRTPVDPQPCGRK
jgi:hypothetical protein